ncbi:MAG TPA: T9SS type A sorting domain-containing protein [Saprospiraceae bacterium]|nr:T9SS type A sorting domain-containing protein [Saprospiraceae bacterium]
MRFPNDFDAPNCAYQNVPVTEPLVQALSSNSLVAISYHDQAFFSLPDTCFKILRTWKVIDWSTFDPALPLVKIYNPAGYEGPTISPKGTPGIWAPSQMGGINYAGLWSANANGYEYVQIFIKPQPSNQHGLFIRFPRDVIANNCNLQDSAGWAQPLVRALGASQPVLSYTDQVLPPVADTCFKIIRTWHIVDQLAAPGGPVVQVPNPPGLAPAPVVAEEGTLAPWQPYPINGLDYADLWNPDAREYTYQQVIFAKPTGAAGLFVRFPSDVVVNSCNIADTSHLPRPQVLALSTELVGINYEDAYLPNPPEGCLRLERTWRIIDWHTHNPALPLVQVPNPANMQAGPIVSKAGAFAPWQPSIAGGTHYSTLWSATANGYEYKQIILLSPLKCPNDPVLVAPPPACTAPLDYTVETLPGWQFGQTAGLPSGASFPLGTTTNTFQVLGATITCSFQVTVKDIALPTARCQPLVVVSLGEDDPQDCFEGGVKWVQASTFNNGSTDDCSAIRLTIRRRSLYSDCILGLNPINGYPDCQDIFPDFPSEFERAISEYDSIKFYCCENATTLPVILRAYQLNPNGSIATDLNGLPAFGECLTTVRVLASACPDTVPQLSGYIQLDTDGDCQPQATQTGIPGMVLRLLQPAGDTLYSSTSLQGYYRFVDPAPGTSTLEVLPPLPLWVICDNPDTVQVLPSYKIIRDFSAQPDVSCPVLTVDLATNLLRPCATSHWYVSYCNLGGADAQDAYVKVVTAAPLQLVDASEPYTLSGDTLTVPVGHVGIGHCGGFSVRVAVPCDPAVIGDELCVSAHIYPDTLCLPPSAQWSGAQIEADAVCEGDSVSFTLRNTGSGPTTQSLDYVIIDDMVIMLKDKLPAGFAPGDELKRAVPSQGEVLRLRAAQEPGHPTAQPPSVALQNCNGNANGGFLLEFENEDGSSFTDLECREVVASYDPNEKLAFPRGFSEQHFIEETTRLTYQINFQNTGTDTAFLVVLRDTLSALLDPASIRVGASSHPYTWSLSGKGIAEFRFENILLPDSSTNEAASHGFVQFYIDQRPGNAIGSRIENRAGIYFDLVNPVVLTNTVWHTVGKDFVATSSARDLSPAEVLQVFPNPAQEQAFVSLSQPALTHLRLLDVLGRPMLQATGRAPGITLLRGGLPAGVYFLEVWDEAKGWHRAGRLVWK